MIEEWLSVVDPSWQKFLEDQLVLLKSIEVNILKKSRLENILPSPKKVLRCLEIPVDKVKVVIIGQDPYPRREYACGLAFAVELPCAQMPKSLLNIKSELINDLSCEDNQYLDLIDWHQHGVMLLNRVLTIEAGSSNSHANLGWEIFTLNLIRYLDLHQQGVAILWGNMAMRLESEFRNFKCVKSAHPSPLSAYRGFFGSRPFSNTNNLLTELGIQPIDWCAAISTS